MIKKVSVYLLVAGMAFAIGSVSTGRLFAEKTKDDSDKKFEQILKKLDTLEKNQEKIIKSLNYIRYRAA